MNENKIKEDLERFYGYAREHIIRGEEEDSSSSHLHLLFFKFYDSVSLFYSLGHLSKDIYLYAQLLDAELFDLRLFSARNGVL